MKLQLCTSHVPQQIILHNPIDEHLINVNPYSWVMIQVDIGGHPPSPTGPKHVSGNFGNLLFLAVFNFRGHFEALNDVF
jgi:hypothetical protein